MSERGHRKERTGLVVSNKMKNTITVNVERALQHPMYKKVMKRTKKYHADDPKNEASIGDLVRIVRHNDRLVAKLRGDGGAIRRFESTGMVLENVVRILQYVAGENPDDVRIRTDDLALSEAIEREEATAGETPGVSTHMAEQGADQSSHDLNLERMDAVTREIREIDAALERVRDGSYGVCETCVETIAGERLEAIPYARLCFPCKKEEERA